MWFGLVLWVVGNLQFMFGCYFIRSGIVISTYERIPRFPWYRSGPQIVIVVPPKDGVVKVELVWFLCDSLGAWVLLNIQVSEIILYACINVCGLSEWFKSDSWVYFNESVSVVGKSWFEWMGYWSVGVVHLSNGKVVILLGLWLVLMKRYVVWFGTLSSGKLAIHVRVLLHSFRYCD